MGSELLHRCPESDVVVLGEVIDTIDFELRHDEGVAASLGVDVEEGEGLVVFVNFIRGDFPSNNFGKNSRHGDIITVLGEVWYNVKMKFSKSYEPDAFEAEIYAAWEAASAFDKEKQVKEGEKAFSIVMPPPNANGNLHIGHGLTIALEDSLTRYHRLRGEATWYVPGADHAGFETWVVYEKALEKIGHTRFEYSRDELYAQVWDFVAEQRGNMELQVRSLGASCAWKDLTFTLDENVVSRVYKTFEKMWKDGMIYRGEKLVNYCPKHQTAFADIEVKHEDEEGKLWDIEYKGEGFSVVVSTTRPETLFGDTAVAVNPADERYKEIVGKKVKLPLTDREIPVIADEHADMNYGTGAVKITPAHDYDDFEVGLRHDLPRIRVIDDAGRMMGCGEPYDGLSTVEARKKALEALKRENLLRGEKKIKHAVAHCYKCDTVIEPTLKEQWFIDVEKLAKMAIEHLERDEIKFYPANKKKVLIDYLKGLKDWNISRQIPWGIPIPMFYSEEKDEWIFDIRTQLKEIEVGGVKYIRDEDTFDTWFSSAHWPIVCTDWVEEAPAQEQPSSASADALLTHRMLNTARSATPASLNLVTPEQAIRSRNPYYPLSVMETGADILFAWVARMIMMGVYVTGEVPFREVYLHGLVLDEHGKKMSKSKGNVINPIEMVSKYGSDAFRLGILRGRSAGLNQAFSEQSIVVGRNLCNKLWNVSRYIQSLVDEAGEVRGGEEYTTENMGEDWICREIETTRKAIEKDMKEYRFAEAVESLQGLIWDKYADWFLESQKIYKNTALLKRTLEDILVMLHPFAPFATEAIWQNLSWTKGMIIRAEWPSGLAYDPISAENFERLMVGILEVRRASNELLALNKGKKYGLLYGDDSLVDDNSLLVQKLAGVPSICSIEGTPRGIRMAVANRELYLDVPKDVVAKYKDSLTERILKVGRELDALEARMRNPSYVEKAPEKLVKETRDGIEEKKEMIERLKKELEVIE